MDKLKVPVGPSDHTQGPADAPVTLVEYGDYECPYCGRTYPIVKALQKRTLRHFQAAFSYGIVQKVIGIRPNRSHMLLEGGYAVSRRLTLRALAESQITNGGLNIPQDYDLENLPNLRWSHHDQISNINSLSLGGGFAWP